MKQAFDERRIPTLLLLVMLLAHGLLLPLQGYSWDDFPITRVTIKDGNVGRRRYFSTSRPV